MIQLQQKQQQLEIIEQQIENETDPVVLDQLNKQKEELTNQIAEIKIQIAFNQTIIEANTLIPNVRSLST